MSLGADLEDELKKQVQALYKLDYRLEFLPGDASNRRYARLHLSNHEKRILMVLNAPEAFKSEEAVANPSGQEQTGELDFVRIQKSWVQKGVRVPKLDYVDPENRFLLTEDLGDQLLFDRCKETIDLNLYKTALDELHKIQALPNEFPYRKSSFSRDLLKWELQHFFEYALEERNKLLSPTEASLLGRGFDGWLDRLQKIPQCVVHRDYHSKNLMILPDDKIGVIDFQDALAGPEVYDLASLLRDSYIRLNDSQEKELFDYFNSHRKRPVDYEDFALASLQRNLKAVGRFFYIHLVKKKPTHLPFVKPSLLRIFRTLEDLGENEIRALLLEKLEGDY